MRALLKRAPRRGTMIVEAALVFPLLVVLVFGMIEYAWVFVRVQQIHHAARLGARTAAIAGPEAGTWHSKVEQVMTTSGISGWAATVDPGVDVATGERVTVTVTVSCANNNSIDLMGAATWLPIPSNLRADVSMAKEGA